MRRYIIKTLAYLAPVFIGVVFCEVASRSGDNDYKYKNKWLTEHSQSVKILSLGSSHGYFGIDPTCFTCEAFNAGHVSQDLKYDNFIFRKFIDKMDSLQVLILPVSVSTPYSNLEKGIEKWRVKNYMMFYHCPYHSFDLKYRLAIYDGIHPKKMIKKVMGMLDERYCTDLGQGTQYKLEKRSDDWQMSGEVAAQRHTGKGVNWKQYSKNQEYIYSIIQKCNDRGIQVILLTTPTYITYREHLPKEVLEVKDELCNKLQNTFDNVVYLNMLDDSRFVPDDFFDADHLNEFGAQKLTYILNDFIQRNQ